METGKKAVETVKEATANIGASANSGMEKSKAMVQEKIDKFSAKDDYEKGIATEVKDQRITEAELHKQQAMSHNAAEKVAKTAAAAGAKETGGGAQPELHKQQDMDHDAAEKDARAAAAAGAKETGGGAEPELHKQHDMDHDAAEKDARAAVAETRGIGVLGTETGTTTGPQYSHSTTGATGQPTGAHQMSAMPGHGTGEPLGGHVVEGTQVGSHPVGKATGTNTRTTTAQNSHVGGGSGPGYTGTGYSG